MWLVLFVGNRYMGACPEVGVFCGDFAPSARPELRKECCACNTSRLCDVIRARAEQGPTRTLFFCSVYFLLFQSIFQFGASFTHIPVLAKNWLMFERIPTYLQRNIKVVPPIISQSPSTFGCFVTGVQHFAGMCFIRRLCKKILWHYNLKSIGSQPCLFKWWNLGQILAFFLCNWCLNKLLGIIFDHTEAWHLSVIQHEHYKDHSNS